MSSGFRGDGLGFRVQGSGSRVQGSGFGVQGPGFKVQGVKSLTDKFVKRREDASEIARRPTPAFDLI